jgi:hypothetical protein
VLAGAEFGRGLKIRAHAFDHGLLALKTPADTNLC